MTFKAILMGMSDRLPGLIFIAIRVIFIAIVFEFASWLAARRIESATSPIMSSDAAREPNWRIRRRTTLRQTPKIISRCVLYAVALILVFDVFGVPVLPLSLAVGAVALFFGAALLPLMRDMAQGYVLLAEDSLAIGDRVEINGYKGTVEKFTLRATWLRDIDGRFYCLSNRDIKDVVGVQRRTEMAQRPEGS